MATCTLTPDDLRVSIATESLGFSSTSELVQHPLPWIGQGRAQTAARFGLGTQVLPEECQGPFHASLVLAALMRSSTSAK